MSTGSIPFRKEMAFEYGRPDRLATSVRRVVAENPSPFTFHGTNSYIVGDRQVAVIDPGPSLSAHIENLIAAIDGAEVRYILVTHTHLDHSPAAALLQQAVGGEIVGAFPAPPKPGEAPVEAGQSDFRPDIVMTDGGVYSGEGWSIEALHTPGHMSNHHCLVLDGNRGVFSGDHVMGWNTTVVSPPDGNMRQYFASLRRCLERDDPVYWPGHGPEIPKPRPFVRAYLTHRTMRESEILKCLGNGMQTIGEIVPALYAHIPENMHKAAARSVFAHMEHLVETGRASCDGEPSADSEYRPA